MVDLVRRADAIRDAAVVGGARPRTASRIAAFFRSLNIWFWAIVGLPTLLAGVYFFGIASDLYLSEVKFLVRGPAKPQLGGLSAMLSSAAAVVGLGRHLRGARVPDVARRRAPARARRRSARPVEPTGRRPDQPLPRLSCSGATISRR